MSMTGEVLLAVTVVMGAFLLPITLWTVITTLGGLKKPRDLVAVQNKLHRFAVVVCARNEEAVIGHLLQSLQKQDYAGEFQAFVVADNCTDNTAMVAEQNGAIVFRRNDMEQIGKGYALQYGINRIRHAYDGEFDAVCVFDADNLADVHFLREMNTALNTGAEVALGYRDTKNIHDSWVSEVYSLYWLMLQRFYHTARHNMGLSSMVGGTGFAFRLDALGEDGWSTASITEDVEFSIQQILKGHRIVPARKAVFYDEQPVDFKTSVKQRLRWMTGGMQCIPLYIKEVFRAVGKGNKKALDIAWYLFFIPATGLALPMNILSIFVSLTNPVLQPFALPIILGGVGVSFLVAAVVAWLTLRLEKRDIRSMRRAIFLYPVFMFTMMLVALAAMVRPRTEWVPIQHGCSRAIEEMEPDNH